MFGFLLLENELLWRSFLILYELYYLFFWQYLNFYIEWNHELLYLFRLCVILQKIVDKPLGFWVHVSGFKLAFSKFQLIWKFLLKISTQTQTKTQIQIFLGIMNWTCSQIPLVRSLFQLLFEIFFTLNEAKLRICIRGRPTWHHYNIFYKVVTIVINYFLSKK